MTLNRVSLENPFMLQERRAELLVTSFLTSDFATPFLKVSNEKYSYFNICRCFLRNIIYNGENKNRSRKQKNFTD